MPTKSDRIIMGIWHKGRLYEKGYVGCESEIEENIFEQIYAPALNVNNY